MFSCNLDSPWISRVAYAGTVSVLLYLLYREKTKEPRCNRQIQQDKDKVVDFVDIEDLGDKAVFCRCWKSQKFPYCDGSHAKHNKVACDNVGPLIVKKKEPAQQ